MLRLQTCDRLAGAFVVLFAMASLTACQSPSDMSQNDDMAAPVAKKVPFEMTDHGDTRVDNYFWMRLSDDQKKAESADAQTQDVIDYLEEENQYIDDELAHTQPLQDKLFDEIVGRIKKDDTQRAGQGPRLLVLLPLRRRQGVRINCRKPAGEETKYEECTGEEQVMLDQNELAEGHDYFAVGGMGVSDDNRILAFGVDTVSRRQYNVHFKDLQTGEMLPDEIPSPRVARPGPQTTKPSSTPARTSRPCAATRFTATFWARPVAGRCLWCLKKRTRRLLVACTAPRATLTW